MKLVMGVVLLPGLQKVNPGLNQGMFRQTNVLLIRLLTMGHVFFMLDTISGNAIQQLVYEQWSGSGGTMAKTAGVETVAWGRELILDGM